MKTIKQTVCKKQLTGLGAASSIKGREAMPKTVNSTPKVDGFRMPGEFEQHDACWILPYSNYQAILS